MEFGIEMSEQLRRGLSLVGLNFVKKELPRVLEHMYPHKDRPQGVQVPKNGNGVMLR